MEVEVIARELDLQDLAKGYAQNRIEGYCKNCQNYAQNWSCPPLNFRAAELFAGRDSILLTACKLSFTEDEREASKTQDLDWFSLELLRELKQAALFAMRELESELKGSLALAFGACDYCEICSRPEALCRKPQLMRYSLEALGYDLAFLSAEYLNLPLRWAKESLPEYFVLLGGLVFSKSELSPLHDEQSLRNLFNLKLQPCLSFIS